MATSKDPFLLCILGTILICSMISIYGIFKLHHDNKELRDEFSEFKRWVGSNIIGKQMEELSEASKRGSIIKDKNIVESNTPTNTQKNTPNEETKEEEIPKIEYSE